MQQHPHGGDGLHGLAQAHLVGQQGRVPGIEKCHALELIRKRVIRKGQRALADQRFERRLQHVEQPVLELDNVAGRFDAGTRRGFSLGFGGTRGGHIGRLQDCRGRGRRRGRDGLFPPAAKLRKLKAGHL
jgi:hypothetical protein